MRPSNPYLVILFIAACGIVPAVVVQQFVKEPVSRHIHVKNFRYGKDPSVIRCNRGDTLHLTFSTNDTGHSFFLEEFDADAKVSPSRKQVEIFSVRNPSATPVTAGELVIIAQHKGFLKYIVSKSNYRCHVWCGPMHAFEQGKLLILPNTLLVFSTGCLAGIVIIAIMRIISGSQYIVRPDKVHTDLFRKWPSLKRLAVSRWPQLIVTILALVMIYVVIMTTLFGTKVSGRNLGVLLMWAVWLFLLVAVLTPPGGRLWCMICPLPVLGDWIQRRSFFSPLPGRRGAYNNRFSGLFLKWPAKLRNSWLRLGVFMVLATFSTTLVASPKMSGIAVAALIIVPALMSPVWELRSFCRYVCPVSVFAGPFSELSPLALRRRSEEICNNCRGKFCTTGNISGWACPYGLNVNDIEINRDCGLCLECTRSCTYDNVTFYSRPFGNAGPVRDMSEAWLSVAIFTTAIVYSVLYLGHWSQLRDFVNILDKDNWNLFGVYSAIFLFIVLVAMPGLIYIFSLAGKRLSVSAYSGREIFFRYTASLLPLGLMTWIAFVIPMLFANVTFVAQSFSDPFGWGWDFFGTANIPWRQFLPGFVPMFQAVLVLTGLSLSLRNAASLLFATGLRGRKLLLGSIPVIFFLVAMAAGLIVFFTN